LRSTWISREINIRVLIMEKEDLHKIKTRMDSLASESPELPSRVMARHHGTDAL